LSRGPTVGTSRVAASFRRAAHASEADNPPGLSYPTALPAPEIRFARVLPHPPRSGLSVSHALAGLLPPKPFRACFIPVTLLGLSRTSRVFFLPKSWSPLGAFSSPAVDRGRVPVKAHGNDSAPEVFSLRESAPSNGFFRPVRRPIPSWSFPLQGSLFRCRRIGFPTRPLVRFVSPDREAGNTGASECQRAAESAFLLAEVPAFLGFVTSSLVGTFRSLPACRRGRIASSSSPLGVNAITFVSVESCDSPLRA
jgi:hypothetical protein